MAGKNAEIVWKFKKKTWKIWISSCDLPTPLGEIVCSPEVNFKKKNSKAAQSICQLHIDPKQRRQEKWKGRCSQDDGEHGTSQCTLVFLLWHAKNTPHKSPCIITPHRTSQWLVTTQTTGFTNSTYPNFPLLSRSWFSQLPQVGYGCFQK